MPSFKRAAAHLFLICMGVIVALLLAEFGLRLVGLAKPAFYTYDPYRGWGLRPGATGWDVKEGKAYVRINRAGFRGPEISIAKPPDTVRIAVLGDSFTEAQQVPEEQDFCSVAERDLNQCAAAAGHRVQVLNFGVNGYGTAQELMTLRHLAWRFSPDIVVLAVFTGNDILNNSVVLETERCRPFYVYRDGELTLGGPLFDSSVTRMQCMMRFESRLRFDTHQSDVLQVMVAGWHAIKDRLPGRHRHVHRSEGSELGINDVIYKPPADPVWQDAWRVTEGEINLTHREVKNHGAALLVVTLTNGIQVYPAPAVRREYMKRLGVSDLWYPDLRIKALGEREGFPVLVLSQPLQAYADEHHAFLHGFKDRGWGHWNALGHQVGGGLIAQRLCEMSASGAVPGIGPAVAGQK